MSSQGGAPAPSYQSLASLPVLVESYSTELRSREFAPQFTRYTTVVRLRGGGEQGLGEDVTPLEGAQRAFAAAPTDLPLAGRWTLESLAAHLDTLELYRGEPLPPGFPTTFRRWALESAALDLALRQAGLSLAEALGRACQPLRFVNSPLLGADPVGVVRRRLELQPTVRFKLDPAPAWSDEVMAGLSSTGAVDVIDLKGQYPPQAPIALAPDANLYSRLAATFPDPWLEDPGLAAGCREALEGHLQRITWDLPVRTTDDIDRLPIAPRAINIKPARHGTLRRLLDVYDLCATRGLATYAGGMGELGPGREQNQYLASMFHPDAPNDIAPVGYNDYDLAPGLPASPLRTAPAPSGFALEPPTADGAT